MSTSLRDSLILSCGITGTVSCISIFYMYYLKVFLDKYHLPASYVSYVQAAFLIWNAVNDPIMGYMQDLGCCGMTWIMDRRKVILYGGPVFATTFLMFWFPWSTTVPLIAALQLLVSLFIYDTLFTLVLSAYCGLCVEVATTHSDRVRITIFGEIFGLIGGSLILPIEPLTHNLEDFGYFQIFCVGIAILATICFIFCATQISHDKPDSGEEERMQHADELPSTWKSVVSISLQIIKQPRFICLVGGQFFKMMRFVANEQFLIIFIEGLLVSNGFIEKGSFWLAAYYVAIRSAGSALFLLMWYPVSKLGCHSILHGINAVAMVNCVLMLFAGRENYAWLAVFIFIENMISRCGEHGYYMVIAGEVIDSDKRNHDRPSPFSTTIFTLKALFTKPAESLAPIIILSLLQAGDYTQLKNLCNVNSISEITTLSTLSSSCNNMLNGMFHALVLFPAVCAIGEAIFVGVDQFLKYREIKNLKEPIDLK